MNNRIAARVSPTVKARQVQVSYQIDERHGDEQDVVRTLRKQMENGFGGVAVDLRLTEYLTVHNVLGIEDIQIKQPAAERCGALVGDAPLRATVTLHLIVWNAKSAELHNTLSLPGQTPLLKE